MLRVLLVQTQDQTAQFLARFFKERGDAVAVALDLGQAATYLTEFKPDLMILDLHFPGDEWLPFLKLVRIDFPELRILVTNRYPDLQREMRAREQGIKVFVRYPFTRYWLNKALKQLGIQVVLPDQRGTAGLGGEIQGVRVPVRIKITLPYFLLSVVFALVSAYIISSMILKSAQDRFNDQLIETRIQAADWIVRQEDHMLSSLRLYGNVDGFAAAIEDRDAEALRALLLPLAVNSNEEVVEIIGADGASMLTMQKKPGGGPGEYVFSRGAETASREGFVKAALSGRVDNYGDKYAGLINNGNGGYFYVSGPVYASNDEPVGALLVGRSLDSIAVDMRLDILAEVTFYSHDGQPLASTLFSKAESFPVSSFQVDQVISEIDNTSPVRTLMIDSNSYTELLGPWEVRAGQDLGLLGVSMPQSYLSNTSQVVRWEVFALVAAGILLVIGIGLYLAGMITSPLQRLVAASSQVAQGNLDVKVEIKGDDEVAVLAQSFNRMVTGLQEGVIYRDILGRTVSPAVREQLRQTFSSGHLKLEGQEAVGTVLYSDIRSFTTLAEQTDPARVFEWLNEYFSRLVPIVTSYGGVVNKFDGDAMLAFFGILPVMLTPNESAVAACQASLEMIKAIDQLNLERVQRGDPPMITGIGINTGVMIAGGLGSSDRLHYTIIGDTVNTTQRLESLTREICKGNGVLISHATYTAMGDRANEFFLDPLGRRLVKGKMEKILVYRLQPRQPELRIVV